MRENIRQMHAMHQRPNRTHRDTKRRENDCGTSVGIRSLRHHNVVTNPLNATLCRLMESERKAGPQKPEVAINQAQLGIQRRTPLRIKHVTIDVYKNC